MMTNEQIDLAIYQLGIQPEEIEACDSLETLIAEKRAQREEEARQRNADEIATGLRLRREATNA